MNNLATVASLVGQAWAVSANGERREIKVGDVLQRDEKLVTEPGARVELDFGNNQLLTLLGEQQADLGQIAPSAPVPSSETLPQLASLTRDEEAPRAPERQGGSSQPAGHDFVELVRIGEIIEADGITPITVARIQEILRPLGMSLPDREFDTDWRYEHRGEDNGSRGMPSVTVPLFAGTTSSILTIPENATVPATGTFVVTAPNGLQSVSVDGTTVTDITLRSLDPNDPTTHIVVPGKEGDLTLTGYDPLTGTVTYTYQQNGNSKDHSGGDDSITDTFPIIVTDQRNLTSPPGEVVVRITDTAPEAVDDLATIDENTPTVGGNVIDGASGGGGKDILGADDTLVTGVVPGTVPAGSHVPDGNVSTTVTGQYGSLTLNPDGSYTYTLDNDNPAVNALKDGKTLDEVFSYTLTDDDGDQSTATLTITINGKTDGPPTIVPKDGNGSDDPSTVATIGHATVQESGLVDGDGSEKTTGVIDITAPDGLEKITVGGRELDLTTLGALDPSDPTTHIRIPTPYGELVITGFDVTTSVGGVPTVGELHYSYELTTPYDNSVPGRGDNGLDEVPLVVTDAGGESANGKLVINIIDDAPKAEDDANRVTEDATAPVTGNVIGGSGASSDDEADRVGADGATVTAIGSDNVTTNTSTLSNGALVIKGEFGTLTIHPDGSYSYQLDNDNAEVNALKNGDTLSEVFTYTLTDDDGDADTAKLTITIDGRTDGTPTIVPKDVNGSDPSDFTQLGHVTVHERGLTGADSTHISAGSITITTPDGLDSIVIGGEPVSLAQLLALDPSDASTHVEINTPEGKLTLTGFNATTSVGGVPTLGELQFSYELKNVQNTPATQADPSAGLGNSESVPLKVIDAGGAEATGNLVITIVDDVPVARDDASEIDENDLSVTGNVVTGQAPGDEADTLGADGAEVTGVVSGTVQAGSHVPDGNVSTTVTGQYGSLTLNPDGSYTYTLDNDNPAVNALKDGKTLDEVFSYTLTDDDGDQSTATLTITINGKTDGPPTIVPKDGNGSDDPATVATIGHATVQESGLVDGDGSEKTTGVIDITAPDGLEKITVGGRELDLTTLGALDPADPTTHIRIPTPYGELVITGFDVTTSVGGVPTVGELHYSYELTTPYDNSVPGRGDNGLDEVPLVVTDAGGESANGKLVINIIDDAPKAEDDANRITEDATAPVTGNVIGGSGASSDDEADRVGADGATVTAIGSDNVTTNTSTLSNGALVIKGEFGTLTIHPDGSYSYQLDNDNAEVNALKNGDTLNEVFTYTLTDDDGDADTAKLTITINGRTDGPPTIVPEDVNGNNPSDFTQLGHVTVHERGLTGADSTHISAGSITITTPDGLDSIEIGSTPVSLSSLLALDPQDSSTHIEIQTSEGKLTLTGFNVTTSVGGVPTLGELKFNYELENVQSTPADPLDPNVGRSNSESVALKVIDAGGAEATGNLVITIVDDVPVITPDASKLGSLTVDETTLGTPATDATFVEGVFGVNYGADGAATNNALVFALNVAAGGAPSGVVDVASGQGVYLYKEGNYIVGRVANTSGVADASGDIAFHIVINGTTGSVTLTQVRSLQHPDTGNPDDSISLSSSVITLTATATDADGDVVSSTAVNVGNKFSFKDDGPSITTPPSVSTFDEANLANGTQPDASGTIKTVSLNVKFGADGAGDVRFTDELVDSTKAHLESLNLTSAGQALRYVVSNDGHTLTAYRGTGSSEPVFIADIVDPDTNPAYRFELKLPLDHIVGGSSVAELDIVFDHVRVTDRDGDHVDTVFTVEVVDDAPDSAAPRKIALDEDSQSTFFANADATKGNTSIGTGTGTGTGSDPTTAPKFGTAEVNLDGTITYTPNANYSGTDTFTYNTVVNGETKTFTVEVTVKPVADAPQLPHGSESNPETVVLQTPEDTARALGLKLPVITDNARAGNAAADYPERLGAISLDDLPTGAKLYKGDPDDVGTPGVELTPATDGSFTFIIKGVPGYHIAGLPDADDASQGIYLLTKDEYEKLFVLPKENDHTNFDLTLKVTSYEVDGNGVRLNDGNKQPVDLPGASSSQVIKVDVLAVTDEVILTVQQGSAQQDVTVVVDSSDKSATVTFNEDASFNLSNILSATIKDTDGSEERRLILEGLPDGTIVTVGSTVYTLGGTTTLQTMDGSDPLYPNLPYISVPQSGLPNITIQAPKDFSGDIENVKVTLWALDSDSDSDDAKPGMPDAPEVEHDTITLDLYVNPIAGDFQIRGAEGNEDTEIAFLANIRVTDESPGAATGDEEVIKTLSFIVPSEWTVNDAQNEWSNASGKWSMVTPATSADWSGSWNGSVYTITFTPGVSQADREALLKQFKVTPPAHSSKNIALSVTVVSEDTNTVNGSRVTSQEVSRTEELEVTVKPVAERVDGDTDGNSTPDLTMNGNHVFQREGKEDDWFDLSSDIAPSSFDLKAPWSNEDGRGVENGGTAGEGSEETFARLTPYDVTKGGPGTLLEGTYFQYNDGSDLKEVPYNGTPVDIPIAFLDTLKVRGPNNFKGVLSIKVEAVTIDYDENTNVATDPAVSGEAWLTNVILHPVADQVTLKVDARITANEDAGREGVLTKEDTGKPIALNINPTSDDPTETFNVTIEGIPNGASITYWAIENGVSVEKTFTATAVNSKLEIIHFDKANQPTLIPPLNSNETIELSVKAESIDTLTYIDKDGVERTITSDPSAPHILPITITILGVPDKPVLEINDSQVYIENDLDTDATNPNKVDLSKLITELRSGETTGDGSETITLRISGLADGFSVEGAGPVVGNASGTDRVWVVTPQQIAAGTVFIKLPANYSGTVTFNAQPVVTESDNPSDTFFAPANVSFKVTPSPEATLNSNSEMTEDQITRLDLSPVYQNGDTDEVISAVRFEAVPGVEFFSDAAGTTPLVATGGWYELTGADVNSVYAKGPANFSGEIKFDIEYKVTDTAVDGTTGPVETGWQSTEHTLSFQAVTDPIELTLAAINGDTGASSVTLTEAGDVTVSLNIAKQPDDNAGGAVDNIDGSERLTHILIQGVPDGVAVEGAQFTGAGQWLILLDTSLPENTFTGDIARNIVFQVNGSAGDIDNVPITITTFTKDTGSNLVEQDQITWNLTAAFEPGEGTLPKVVLSETGAEQTEDQEFFLSQVVSGSFDTSPTDMASYDMTITLRTAPSDETSFSAPGMTSTEVIENGQPVVLWTKTVTGVTNATAENALKAALDQITVRAPADANRNHGDSLGLDVTVTLHNAGVRSEGNVKPGVELQPVTDSATIGINAPTVKEGEEITITLNVSNPADQNAWTIIDGKLYLQLDGAGLPGELLQDGQALSTKAVQGVPDLPDGQYYVLEGVQPGVDVVLSYKPSGDYPKGSVTLKAWVQNEEAGSVTVLSGGQANLTVNPTNTEPTVVITSEGTEHDGGVGKLPTQLVMTGDALPDASEELQSAFLEGLPKDFTVWYSANPDGSGAVLASNAGGGTWSIPVSSSALPGYIGILPPAHWSGTLEDLTLYLVSGEAGAEPTAWPIKFDFTVEPKADGLDLAPTLSFGKAGDVITLNLNAAMKDQTPAGASDEHNELTTLQLSGFQDGNKVVFYVNGTELDSGRVNFGEVDGVETYTITGLTQAELDDFGFLHAQTEGRKTISVTAWTNEVDREGQIVGADSSPTTENITINVSEKLPTVNNDTLLWTGKEINGRAGDDTIQLRFGDDLTGDDLASKLKNIEVIDMLGRGASKISSLSVEDVFSITDERNTLKILGDSEDTISLDGWGEGVRGAETTVYTATFESNQIKLEVSNAIID
ncbi:hypothetical protein HW090_05595 [Pseudomonas sp. ABC1]|uniref:VCBS domain-containing protein n=1 Tax=Pseudomonas sp. ABC1 TaxID=2748080 RepID=UPI0015C3DB02|nr:VCBS domain-containing protein [Pseudomonas sp. ABC1]QLF92694.1 hypothetical protein HW090_05595 [Pseudomonas sp. ABC1]